MSGLALIDAYNVMFRRWGDVPEDRDVSRVRLVRETAAALRRAKGLQRAHLVFDTWPGASRAGLRGRDGPITWSYAHGSADDAILDHMRKHENRSGGPIVTVVTDDRELAGRARQLGARSLGVRTFYTAAPPSAGPPRSGRGPGGPALTARDFDLPEGEIELADDESPF